ncbi:MAG: DUF502 domain-containing protein [Planctomycetota bacterium]
MSQRRQSWYRRLFFAGIATLLPTILTISVLAICYDFLQQRIAAPLTQQLERALKTDFARQWYWEWLLHTPSWQLDEVKDSSERPQELARMPDLPFTEMVDAHVPNWLGFLCALVLVLSVGFVIKGYLGRQLLRALEATLLRVPIIRVIYPYAKQLTDFFFEDKKKIAYDRAVAVEYPRAGIYSLGFITNDGLREVSAAAGAELVTVFMPSSPTPMTGYTILVPKRDVIHLTLNVDEALRFLITGGVIMPPSQAPAKALAPQRDGSGGSAP